MKMNEIRLSKIEKDKNVIRFFFSVSKALSVFFTDNSFVIEYSEIIETIPDAIAAVPFVCNVLPIIWLTDSKLIISELDEAFYFCIPEIKKGYEKMFPETIFKGTLEIGMIVPNDRPIIPEKSAMFYSGGVDSMDTLYRHLEEKPTLLSVWGSDIKYDNSEGWDLVHKAIEEAASFFRLNEMVIHSSFREFDNENALNKCYSAQLKDNWWHGMKHGIALLGHVAPLAYAHGFEKMYIASSNCPEDGDVRCASNPLIDNHMRFASCQVIHDGFEFNRQDKIRNIVLFSNKNKLSFPLHVCWESQTGENCCHCEKCFRTIVALIVENANPNKYGFEGFEQYLNDMIPEIKRNTGNLLIRQWTKIQNRIIDNKRNAQKSPYWKYIRWIEKADFVHSESIIIPLTIRLKKVKGLRGKLAEFKVYQLLHELKVKIVK